MKISYPSIYCKLEYNAPRTKKCAAGTEEYFTCAESWTFCLIQAYWESTKRFEAVQSSTNHIVKPMDVARINAAGAAKSAALETAKGPRAKAAAQEPMADFNQSSQLRELAKAEPEVRADRVARARELIQSSEYPPRNLMDQVAGLLARKLS